MSLQSSQFTRRLSFLDRVIIDLDRGLRALQGEQRAEGRDNPAGDIPDAELTQTQRRHAAGLMRVDHAGEVAAQALYHGQSMTARTKRLRETMEQSWANARAASIHSGIWAPSS
jgi:ubiquinone biosynthesis monooxygenase Coq7